MKGKIWYQYFVTTQVPIWVLSLL